MKKLLILSVLFLVFLSSISAQKDIRDELQLSETQKVQYVQIQESQKQQMVSILSLKNTKPELFNEKRIEIFESTDMKMKNLFNDSQWLVYDKFRKQRNQLLNIGIKSN